MSKNSPKTTPVTTCTGQDKILSRRDVLRAALVAGCSLFVPIAIFSSSANGAEPAAATGAKKMAKTAVKYQNKPNAAQKCSTCTNYIAAAKTCKRVEGPINPDGWCILWAAKV